MAISWYNSRKQCLIEKDLVRIYKNTSKGNPVIIISISRDQFRNFDRVLIGIDNKQPKLYLKGDDTGSGYKFYEQANRKLIKVYGKDLISKLLPRCGDYSISIDTENGPNVFALKEV